MQCPLPCRTAAYTQVSMRHKVRIVPDIRRGSNGHEDAMLDVTIVLTKHPIGKNNLG